MSFQIASGRTFGECKLLMSAYSGEMRVLKRKKIIIIEDSGEIEELSRGQCLKFSSSSNCSS